MKQLKYFILAIASVASINQAVYAQKGVFAAEITGTVYESATGKPLAGAQVSIPGVASAITGDNGQYTLNKSVKGAQLVVSAPGFSPRRISAEGKKTIDVTLLDESFKGKYENVVMPFELQNAGKTAVAISAHENKNDYQQGVATIETVLQSGVNGLNTVSRSGMPGAGANMYLNGFTSLNANTQPLIIVDGVPYENQVYGSSLISGNTITALSDIDVKDIDNVTVLKDGSSIYGSKAANGVILINTLRAKEVATRINFYSYAGINMEPSSKYKMMDAWSYKNYLTDMLSSSGMSANEIQSLPFINAEKPVVENWGVSGNKDYYRYNQSTNWQDQVFRSSMSQNYHLNVTGGNDIALYAISVGYLGHEGVVDHTDFSRYTTRVNARIKMTDWFKMNANVGFVRSDRNLSFEGLNRNFNPLYAGLVKAPFTSPYVYNVAGEQTPNLESVDAFNVSNPRSIIENGITANNRSRFSGNLEGIVTFSKDLNATVLIGLTTDKTLEKVFMPQAGISHDALASAAVTNESQQLRNTLMQINTDTRLTYSHLFDHVHDLTARLGARYQSSDSEIDWGKAYNTSSDEMKTLGDGVNKLGQIGGSLGNWKSLTYYLNAEYGYLNRYFVSLNAALDGSSRFGKEADGITLFDTKFGMFPSINGAWLMSSEGFMKNQKLFDVLKLRAGYTITGNDNIGNYSARSYYVPQLLLGFSGLVRGNIPNTKLKWETNKKISAGVDFSLLNERFNLSVDLYSSKTEDLISYKNVSTASGIGYALLNDGAVRNNGIDISVSGRVIDSPDWKWDLGVNVSKYRNKLLSYSTDEQTTQIAGGNILTKVGNPIGLFFGYKTDGVFTTQAAADEAGLKILNSDGSAFAAGDVKFADLHKDGVIDEKDMTVIGNPNPDCYGSISSHTQWRRFSLNALFSFSLGNDVYNAVRANLESMTGTDNQTILANNRWKMDGQQTSTPKAVWGDPMGNARFSDRWIEDGSYLRMKTLTLAYNLPLKSGFVSSAQVYVTGNNLLTFTKYLGYDPEFSTGQSPLYYGIDKGVTPQPRSILFGIKIGL